MGLKVPHKTLPECPPNKGVAPALQPSSRHAILPGIDEAGYRSLRDCPMPRSERFAIGRSLRQQVPRTSLGDWKPAPDRVSPVEQIIRSQEGRLKWLIPVRVGRMLLSPYSFLRGTAGVMIEDLARLPVTGITPVVCGDAHMGNFGFYASPERDLVIDLNDFDEAHPGAWEWDLWRLVASLCVAGRQNGATEDQCRESVQACVRSYRREVAQLANEPLLARSFERINVDRLRESVTDKSLRDEIDRATARAKKSTSVRCRV
jgi:hypothetical protein